MKRLSLILVSLVMLLGCNEEPPPPPHKLAGQWSLSRFTQILDNPNYSYQNVSLYKTDNRYGGINTLIYLFGEDFEDYVLNLNNDKTIKREFLYNGPQDVTENGNWELIDDIDFIIEVDGETIPEEYLIVGSITDNEFTYSESFIAKPLSDADLDFLEENHSTDPEVEPNEEIRTQNELVWDEYRTNSIEQEITWWWTFKRVIN